MQEPNEECPLLAKAEGESRGWRFGLFLASLSGLLFTANNFFVQYFHVDALEMLLVRSTVQSLVLGVVVLAATNNGYGRWPQQQNPVLQNTPMLTSALVAMQAMFGGLKLLFNFACLSFLPLGDALTLIFTEPLFTVVFSLVFLRIGVGPLKVLCCLGLLAGMTLSVQPPFLFTRADDFKHDTANVTTVSATTEPPPDYFTGAALALSCALCGSLCNILISSCDGITSPTLVLSSGLAGVLLALCCLLQTEDSRILFMFDMAAMSPLDWMVLLAISAVGVLAYFAMTEALKTISPTSVSVMRALEIVLAYACQVAFMGQPPNLTCVLGASLVMVSVVGIAVEEKLYSVRR